MVGKEIASNLKFTGQYLRFITPQRCEDLFYDFFYYL